jgi:BirA family biotin operon repressor/biotin-[acetyl-CoA-carboxylase] ligase
MTSPQDRLRQMAPPGFISPDDIHWLFETASTQNDCRRLTEEANRSVVVIADRQSAGRGQYGRTWEAPSGLGLLISVSLPGPTADSKALSMWAAAAIAVMLEQEFGMQPRVKWPNDVLVNGRKIAGVLVETRGSAVVGIGLNVLQQAGDFPPQTRLPPTSIAMETKANPDRVEVAASLLEELSLLGSPSDAASAKQIFGEWRTRLDVQSGDQVLATLAESTTAGEFIDLEIQSGLRLRTDTGVARIPLERLVRLEQEAAR